MNSQAQSGAFLAEQTDQKQKDQHVYRATSLKEAERARLFLLRRKPRPFVFVYVRGSEYDVHIADEFGRMPSQEFLLETKQALTEEMAKPEEN